MNENILTYGLKKGTTDILLHVDDVPNGAECDCVCPECHQGLIAKNKGSERIHHFAHINDADCKGARMTALHLLAQKILERDKFVMLPAYKTRYLNYKAQQKHFDNVILEQVWKDDSSTRRPDCVCSKEGSDLTLWVEIYCCHKVDTNRRQDIIRRKQYCIEIDFSDLLDRDYTEKDVIRRLAEETQHREWICCPKWDKENEAKRTILIEERRRREEVKREEQLREIEAQKNREKQIKMEQRRLEDIVSQWEEEQNIENAERIIVEFKHRPYAPKDGYPCIFDILVPNKDWIRFIKTLPQTEVGKMLFYSIIHYYFLFRLDLKNQINEISYLRRCIGILLNKNSKCSEGENIFLEYLLTLWILHRLNYQSIEHKQDANLSKIIVINKPLRDKVFQIIREHKLFNNLSMEDTKTAINNSLTSDTNKESIMQILNICFPTPPKPQESKRPTLWDEDMDYVDKHPEEGWVKFNEFYKNS